MNHKLGYLAFVGALLAAGCSSGADEGDVQSTATTAAGADAESETDDANDANDLNDLNDPNDDSPSDAASDSDDGTVDVDALQATPAEVVAPDAELRCERLGYTCSWSDVEPARFDELLELASEIQGIVDAGASPSGGLDDAVERLASEQVVEVIVDREGATGMLYRLEGTPELFATTAFAAPLGDPVTLDLTELEAQLNELAAANASPIGFGPGPNPRSYHPTGGPIVPKRGIVLDPYATEEAECPPQTPLDGCLRDPKDGRNEGSVIYGIMNAHPQVEADYFAGSDVAPWNLTNLRAYDLLHIASHGTSGCANKNRGWTTGVDDPAGFVASKQDIFASTPLDPNECYSVSVLGKFDKAKYDAWGQRVPPGIGMNGSSWGATTDFFVGKLKPESIVYFSNCTSADGQLYASGSFGSFVGWHSYARTTVAYEGGVEFWRLMVAEGVEFEVAIANMSDAGLSWSITAGAGDGEIGATGAFLASRGKNQRARDVITARIDGADLGGQVLRVAGLPEDSQPEFFPAEGQQLTFDVEGVTHGTAGSVMIEVHADGTKLESDIQLERDGVVIEPGDEWDDWRVTVRPNAVKLTDTNAADYRPDADPIELEVRAYLEQTEYTADKGEVTLGTRLASNGPLPIFTELAAGMPANGEVRGNDLQIDFDTAGGEVIGAMRVEMLGSGFEIGYWKYDLTGTYDPQSGMMTGDLVAESQGGVLFIQAGDSGSGTWQASVDLSGKRVSGTLGAGDATQRYEGTITSATG